MFYELITFLLKYYKLWNSFLCLVYKCCSKFALHCLYQQQKKAKPITHIGHFIADLGCVWQKSEATESMVICHKHHCRKKWQSFSSSRFVFRSLLQRGSDEWCHVLKSKSTLRVWKDIFLLLHFAAAHEVRVMECARQLQSKSSQENAAFAKLIIYPYLFSAKWKL